MIDWVLALPKELELTYKIKVQAFEEERSMSYITSIERFGREEGLQQGLRQGLAKGLYEAAQALRNLDTVDSDSKKIQKEIQKLIKSLENEVIDLDIH